jgi:glucose-1-phosphate thymidylyltransferase
MTMGIIPAAGIGTRIQPLAFSKELLPVGSRFDGTRERPRAVSEYLVERLIAGGAERLCFVISPEKTDIMHYFGAQVAGVPICYVLQQQPAGLCDAIFSALPFVEAGEDVLVGLPDTVWFPAEALQDLPDRGLSFLLFPVENPHLFDAVVVDACGFVQQVQVKNAHPTTSWIWGAFKMAGQTIHELHRLWCLRDRQDEFFGTLVNAHLQRGGRAVGVKAGTAYVDVGTFDGYRRAIRILQSEAQGTLGPHQTEEDHEHHEREHA